MERIIIVLFGEEKHFIPFCPKDFIYFIIRHIGKNLHILKKIENGNKMDIFPIKKYVHKYALSNVKMVIILQNNNKYSRTVAYKGQPKVLEVFMFCVL